MKIAVLAHIRHAIAEPFSGGMEAHCAGLCDGLRVAGHDVTLFAAAGSRDANLVEICADPYETVLPWSLYRGSDILSAYQKSAFERAQAHIEAGDFDVVHNNSLHPGVIAWAADAGIPCVTSQHVPPFGSMADAVGEAAPYAHVQFTVTSGSQLDLWSSPCRTNMRVVPNGVDCERWQPVDSCGEYLTWIGRIVPNKGLAQAVAAARIANVPMRIFGPIEDVSYFADRVEPLLSGGLEYHGHARAADLVPVLAASNGAVVTPMWDEPFGLVAAEALACGVPVIAFDRGAMREVIGPCGIVVDGGDVGALAKAMGRIHTIDRAACRERALRDLSVSAMIAGYEKCYADAIDHAAAAPLAGPAAGPVAAAA
ncbi:MAG: glycosyltransferase [Pontixanthobacter sp.]